MPVYITFFTHGTTSDNEQNISSGWKDVSLSELGIKQSINLKNRIEGIKFDVVFCSDLKRGAESANLTFGDIVPVICDHRLRECNYGQFNGKPMDVLESRQEKYIAERFPGGESCEDVKSRMADFCSYLRRAYDGKLVAVVAHRTPQLALDVLIKGKTWEQAFAEDWRKTKSWQPGWKYILE